MNPRDRDLPLRGHDPEVVGIAGVPIQVSLAIDETDLLIASDKVAGTAVYGREGERLGTIYNVMIDKASGRIAYVVMAFGGFLGVGERFYALPWKTLTYVPQQGGYVVGVSRKDIEAAPACAGGEQLSGGSACDRNVHGYRGFEYGL